VKKAAVPPTGATVSDMGSSGAPERVADTAVVAHAAAFFATAIVATPDSMHPLGPHTRSPRACFKPPPLLAACLSPRLLFRPISVPSLPIANKLVCGSQTHLACGSPTHLAPAPSRPAADSLLHRNNRNRSLQFPHTNTHTTHTPSRCRSASFRAAAAKLAAAFAVRVAAEVAYRCCVEGLALRV